MRVKQRNNIKTEKIKNRINGSKRFLVSQNQKQNHIFKYEREVVSNLECFRLNETLLSFYDMSQALQKVNHGTDYGSDYV